MNHPSSKPGVYPAAGLLTLALVLLPVAASAQQVPAGRAQAAAAPAAQQAAALPNVYFDCQGPACDQNYYRTEIPWVNWVRQPEDSHVHVIVTNQGMGAGGQEFILDFGGRAPYADYKDRVTYRSASTDTERERLDGLAHTLSIGLARFADSNGFRGIARVASAQPTGGRAAGAGGGAGGVVAAGQVNDPWNLWTFRIGGNANLNGQQTQSNLNAMANFNASRVTPVWRMSYGGNVNYNKQTRELSSGTLETVRTNFGFNGLMVNSLAGHWSGGLSMNVQRMTNFNQDIQVALNPALEYSYFPYEEATRRSFTMLYQMGPQYRNYQEETVYGLLEETQVEHSLEIELSQRQTWGDAGITLNGSQFLKDLGKYRVGVNGNLSFRIFRGLSVNMNANYSKQTNQIYLASGGATDEEILLNLRARASGYNYGMMFGLNYQFGSIFNNVVNNRFGGAGGGPGGGGNPGGGGGGGGGRGG